MEAPSQSGTLKRIAASRHSADPLPAGLSQVVGVLVALDLDGKLAPDSFQLPGTGVRCDHNIKVHALRIAHVAAMKQNEPALSSIKRSLEALQRHIGIDGAVPDHGALGRARQRAGECLGHPISGFALGLDRDPEAAGGVAANSLRRGRLPR